MALLLLFLVMCNSETISDTGPFYLKSSRGKIITVPPLFILPTFSLYFFIFHSLRVCYVKKVSAELNAGYAHNFPATTFYLVNTVLSQKLRCKLQQKLPRLNHQVRVVSIVVYKQFGDKFFCPSS